MSMKKHHLSRASLLVLCGIGLAVAAAAALIALWYNQLPQNARARIATRISPRAATYEKQKKMIDVYVQDAMAIHSAFRAHTITGSQAKTRALALTVPGVLKERHLAWIIALDKNEIIAADDIMRDYALLGAVQ